MLIRQANGSAVWRIPTHGWLKTVPPLFAHEGRVAQWVGAVVPDAVPRVLAVGDGWLLTEEMPAPTGPATGHPLDVLAQIQLASVDRTRELLDLGCPHRSVTSLVMEMAALSERDTLLGADLAGALRGSIGDLERSCQKLADFPETLVHGDLWSDNHRWTGRGWMLYDWTDACVGHPFLDLARTAADLWDADAIARYIAKWSAVEARVVPLALHAGAAHQSESHRRIIDAQGATDALIAALRVWVTRVVSGPGWPRAAVAGRRDWPG